MKACIAKKTAKYDFPDKQKAIDCYTHDLTKLVNHAELSQDFRTQSMADAKFDAYWAVVKDWSEADRYDRTITVKDAADLYKAITANKSGVMRWVRQHW